MSTETITAPGYWHAGEHTTSRNDSGYCPARTCEHRHRTENSARRCAAIHFPWTVYYVDADGVTHKADSLLRPEID